MQSYVLMLQTDDDDRYLTESTLEEIGATVPVKFVRGLPEMNTVIELSGLPSVFLVNDSGAMHKGNKLLKQIKAEPAYGHIPVVMLGEFTTPEYIQDCYRAGVNTYIIKPSSLAETKKKIETFFSYWSEVADV